MALPAGDFKIDNITIPTPTTYKWGEEDLSSEETGRTLDGVMHKDVIAVKEYYECTWKRLSWSAANTLLSAIHGKTKVVFTHLSPFYPNTWVTGNFYVGKRSTAALNLEDPNHAWSDIAFTFTEI